MFPRRRATTASALRAARDRWLHLQRASHRLLGLVALAAVEEDFRRRVTDLRIFRIQLEKSAAPLSPVFKGAYSQYYEAAEAQLFERGVPRISDYVTYDVSGRTKEEIE